VPVPLVVDTNVLAIAEGMNDAASADCVAACKGLVLRIDEGYRILVDEGDEILAEYLGTLSHAGTSGLAARLAEVLWRTRFGGERCDKVAITPIDTPPGSYDEVPIALRDFDIDDQKVHRCRRVHRWRVTHRGRPGSRVVGPTG
jgi:hypothetical protein